MSSNLGANASDASPLYTLAMLIILAFLMASAAVWFAAEGMKGTAVQAMGWLALQKGTGSGSGGGSAGAAGQTLNFTLQGQRFSRALSGEAAAPVVMAEFSDFQCPYCIQVLPTLRQLEQKYAGQIKRVHMNFVVHSGARLAALADECAGEQGRYWEMHDAIFAQQKYDKSGLGETGASIGLDVAKLYACLDSGKYEAAIDAQQTAGEGAGVDGTPSFIIGKIKDGQLVGKKVVGALPLADFEREIQAALNS